MERLRSLSEHPLQGCQLVLYGERTVEHGERPRGRLRRLREIPVNRPVGIRSILRIASNAPLPQAPSDDCNRRPHPHQVQSRPGAFGDFIQGPPPGFFEVGRVENDIPAIAQGALNRSVRVGIDGCALFRRVRRPWNQLFADGVRLNENGAYQP